MRAGWSAVGLHRFGVAGEPRTWAEADGDEKWTQRKRSEEAEEERGPRAIAPPNFSARTALRAKGRPGGSQVLSSLEPSRQAPC